VRRAAVVFGAGLLFGAGLVVSGMTDPRNVVGFLDFAGRWNPKLAFVMAGAVGVHALLLRLHARRRGAAARSGPGARARIDAPLVCGAAIFGVGWGLSGYCPGPAITALGFGLPAAFGFVAAMIAGARLGDRVLARRAGGPDDVTCSAEG
jgi:uncharacterized membrane protein YedE/YeeE